MGKTSTIFATLFVLEFVRGELTLPQQKEYEVCTTEGDFCLPLQQCPFYKLDDLKRENRPTLCGYNGTEPIVCCTTDSTTIFMHQYNRHTVTGQMCAKYEKTICSKDGGVKVEEDDGKHLKRIEYMALLGYKNGGKISWNCSGTLISPRYVLSAASCTKLNGLGLPIYARIGHGLKRVTARVTVIFVHPDYNHPAFSNDIALYRLNHTVQLHDEIQPICLHEYTSILTTNHIYARKWMSRETNEESQSADDSIAMDLIPYERCKKAFKDELPDGFHKQGMICAGEKSRRDRKVCWNEQGGPITLPPTPKQYESNCFLLRQAGLWTQAFKCNRTASIGVFTNVAHYIHWIEAIVWPDNTTSTLQIWQ